jgi:hypothetical protein
MALGLSFIDVDLGKAAPLVGIAALGVAIWYVWTKSEEKRAAADAQQQASPLAAYQAAQDLALIKSITGAQSVPTQTTQTAPGGAAAPQADPLLPTYSAPGNYAQNFTMPASNGVSLGAASATSNGI